VLVDGGDREQEDRNSLQRATFFISLALPIIVPQMLIFGGLLAYFTVAEFSIILLYTTSNPQANVWKWVSRLESVALLTLAPLVIWHRSNSGWVDLYVSFSQQFLLFFVVDDAQCCP